MRFTPVLSLISLGVGFLIVTTLVWLSNFFGWGFNPPYPVNAVLAIFVGLLSFPFIWWHFRSSDDKSD